jgi:hypothetical protein
MLFVIYLAWMSPTYCNSRQNVFDAYVISAQKVEFITCKLKSIRNMASSILALT